MDESHEVDEVEVTRPDGTTYIAKRLPCGCLDECDPFAHDTAWDWDGTPSPPSWDDLSPAEYLAEKLKRWEEEWGDKYE